MCYQAYINTHTPSTFPLVKNTFILRTCKMKGLKGIIILHCCTKNGMKKAYYTLLPTSILQRRDILKRESVSDVETRVNIPYSAASPTRNGR